MSKTSEAEVMEDMSGNAHLTPSKSCKAAEGAAAAKATLEEVVAATGPTQLTGSSQGHSSPSPLYVPYQ